MITFFATVTALLDTVITVTPAGVTVIVLGDTVSCAVFAAFTTRLPALADDPLPAPPVCSVSCPPAALEPDPSPVPDDSVSPEPAAALDVPSALPTSPTVTVELNVVAFATVTALLDTVITVTPAGVTVRLSGDTVSWTVLAVCS